MSETACENCGADPRASIRTVTVGDTTATIGPDDGAPMHIVTVTGTPRRLCQACADSFDWKGPTP